MFDPRALPDPAERREGFEQPIARFADEAGQERKPGEHEKAAHDAFNERKMGAKAGENGGKRLDCQSRNDERNAEPQRIDPQQPRPFGDRRF